ADSDAARRTASAGSLSATDATPGWSQLTPVSGIWQYQNSSKAHRDSVFIYHAGLYSPLALPVPRYRETARPVHSATGGLPLSDPGLYAGLAQDPAGRGRYFCQAADPHPDVYPMLQYRPPHP